jgi:dephospho-CoA kinase
VIVVGLTGGIGAGKSTVATGFAKRGAVIIDADLLAREVVEPGGPAYDAVVEHFGPEVVGAGGRVDRAAIARRAFSNPAELAVLNRLTHPAIAALMAKRLDEARDAGARAIVLDVPLLTTATREVFDLQAVIVVDAPPEVTISRLVEQRGFDPSDAQARVAAQASREERLALADIVIDNSGDRAALEGEIDRAWRWIEEHAGDT